MGTYINFHSPLKQKHSLETPKVMKLVYWPGAGRAHVTRAILHYHEHPFEDVYQDRAKWAAEKAELASKMISPNLPYLVDGGLHISESLAIAKHVARKVNCIVVTPKELAIQDQFEGLTTGILENIIKIRFYTPEGEARDEAGKKFKDEIVEKLQAINEFLKNRKWICGDNLSWVDFYLHSVFNYLVVNQPKVLELTGLKGHTDRILEKASYKKFYDKVVEKKLFDMVKF